MENVLTVINKFAGCKTGFGRSEPIVGGLRRKHYINYVAVTIATTTRCDQYTVRITAPKWTNLTASNAIKHSFAATDTYTIITTTISHTANISIATRWIKRIEIDFWLESFRFFVPFDLTQIRMGVKIPEPLELQIEYWPINRPHIERDKNQTKATDQGKCSIKGTFKSLQVRISSSPLYFIE